MRLFAAWLALGGAALAAENVRLVYQRDPGAEACPDEAAVRRAVAGRLGYDPFVESQARRTVRAVIAPQGRWLRASIELSDESGEQLGTNQLTPHVHDCDTLASAMELAIALAIDPLRASGIAPTPSPTPSPEPEIVVAPPPRPVVLVLRRAPHRVPTTASEDYQDDHKVHLVGRLAILAAVASAPEATWGIELGLAAQWHRFSVGAELRGDLPGSHGASGGTIASSLVIVSFLPCVHAYGFFFCGLLSGGVVIAYGAEFAVDRRVILPFGGGGARAGVELRLNRRLALGLHADLLAPFTRALLKVDDQEVFHADPVSGAFAILLTGVIK